MSKVKRVLTCAFTAGVSVDGRKLLFFFVFLERKNQVKVMLASTQGRFYYQLERYQLTDRADDRITAQA